MAEIRLTTTANIVKNTPMGGNVDISNYIYLIDIVQKTVLEPVLGTKLYEKIKVDYNANALTGLYLQMHTDYIEQFLNYSVFARYTHSGSNRVRNNGNLKASPNNAEQMTNEENISFENEYMSAANFYLNDLESFLNVEQGNIPEYISQDNDYDKEAKDNVGYRITWFLK